jgi:heat shock protein HslJ
MRRSWVLGMVATAWLVAGCGLGTQTPAPEAAEELVDRSFVSTAVVREGEPHTLVQGPLEVSFRSPPGSAEGGNGAEVLVAWTSGCNHYGLRVEVFADRLEHEEGLGPDGTAIGCDPAMTDQERWLTEFFTDAPRWELEGSDLVLVSSDVEIELEEGSRDPG